MSILQAPRTPAPDQSSAALPYLIGDRIVATSPEGTRFRARVEVVKPAAVEGQFTVVAAVTEPRRYRSHLLTTTVDADGYGPGVRPAR